MFNSLIINVLKYYSFHLPNYYDFALLLPKLMR
jgi:hypothetical protein